MTAHAFLPPSSAFRWVRCALSASLEAAYPETEASPSSLEGTAAHWVTQMLLQGTPVAVDMRAPNGVAVTQEMIETAELVRDDIIAKLGPEWRSVLFIERRVQIPRVHPTHNWGTPDYFAWRRMENKNLCLHLWDLKYGHGVIEVFENWQMIDYAAGILDSVTEADTNIVVDFGIIQPRAYHREGPIRHWRVLASDLRAQINILANAAGAAMMPNPKATPTPEGCKNCTGRGHCEALLRAGGYAADTGGQFGALDLPPHALGLELRNLKRAKAMLEACESGLEAQVVASIKAGQLVPFWMLESTPGRLEWTKPAPEIFALGEMLGLKLQKDPEPITPTQAKAVAKAAKIDGALFDAYSTRPTGAAKLTADDGSKARMIFSKP